MAAGKEIRGKIKSVENTQEDHQGDGDGRRLEDAQGAGADARGPSLQRKIRNIAANLAQANPEYTHPFMVDATTARRRVGFIVVTTDKGLCGGLNTNVLRAVTHQAARAARPRATKIEAVAIGNKGLGFLNRDRRQGRVACHPARRHAAPRQADRPGQGAARRLRRRQARRGVPVLHQFINTMKQEPVVEQLLPLSAEQHAGRRRRSTAGTTSTSRMRRRVIDELLVRYVEALVYQAVAENMASEQSARMVAMKAATDNAGNVIGELKLVYNKTRQAAITKELSEIVAGAAAV